MAWQFPISTAGTAFAPTIDLGENDSVLVGQYVTLTSASSIVISSSGSFQEARISGTLLSSSISLAMGNGSDDASNTVIVRSTGTIESTMSHGIYMTGRASLVENHGTINTLAAGIALACSSDTPSTSRIVNTGTIEGGISTNLVEGAAITRMGAGETIELINSGTISSAYRSYASRQTIYLSGDVVYDGVDRITNTGTMIGHILMEGGADLYDGKLGKMVGTVYGGAGIDTLYGGKEANIFDGGTEADIMGGGLGNDIFYVDTKADKVIESSGQGSDTVYTSVSYDLATGVSVEQLQVRAASTVVATLVGNEFAQKIIGGDSANAINGRGGKDILTGGGGNDSFYFDRALNAADNVDAITDFANASGNNDTIRLDDAIFTALGTDKLALAAFRANATGAAADADDRIIFETDTGKIFYDADGNTSGGVAGIHFATISNFASLTGPTALTNADFLIY